MKRLFTLMLALLMLTLPTLAEETAAPPQEGDRPAMGERDAGQRPEGGERPDFAEGEQGGPGGRGGNGGPAGMASTEPDEELLAILAQVQDKVSAALLYG